MGSGNLKAAPNMKWTFGSCNDANSLPLMGSGERRPNDPAAGPQCGHGPHYPSWGVGTAGGQIGRRTGENQILITPHGEWEHQLLGQATGPCRIELAHYPSWGVGTRRCTAGFLGRRLFEELITPHGEWELDRVSLTGWPPALASLPLMGSGNIIKRVLLKPSNRATHYPSWGVGTRRSCLQDRHADEALGISLPLMGSGNTRNTVLGRSVSTRELITPHGEWERSFMVLLRSCREVANSLPLMGSGNLHPVDSCRRSCLDHLITPSWGVGTAGGVNAAAHSSVVTDSLPLMGSGNSSLPAIPG